MVSDLSMASADPTEHTRVPTTLVRTHLVCVGDVGTSILIQVARGVVVARIARQTSVAGETAG